MPDNILDIGCRSIRWVGLATDHAKQASRQRSTPASTMAGRIVDRRRSPSGRLASTWAKLIDSPKKIRLQMFPPQPQRICDYRDGAKAHRRSSNHGVQKKPREWVKNARRYGNTEHVVDKGEE